MNPKIVISGETGADAGATVAVFMTLEISKHTEQFIREARGESSAK